MNNDKERSEELEITSEGTIARWSDEMTITGELKPGNREIRWNTINTDDSPDKIGTGAIKYDKGKPAVWQGVINYFPRALWGVAEVSTFGAEKYAWKGWEGVENGYARYSDAKFRHALLHAMGEEQDEDSELMHLKHEAWGALATLELYLKEKEKEHDRTDNNVDTA